MEPELFMLSYQLQIYRGGKEDKNQQTKRPYLSDVTNLKYPTVTAVNDSLLIQLILQYMLGEISNTGTGSNYKR
jgi:hypothetical protein